MNTLTDAEKVQVLEKIVSEVIAKVERPDGRDGYYFEERSLENFHLTPEERSYIESFIP